MPKLLKDELGERNLFRHPATGEYVVRKSVNGRERYRELKTLNRREALRLKDETIREWGETGRVRGRLLFKTPAFRLLDIMMSKAEKTYLDYEGHLRIHLMPFFGAGYLDEVPRRWAEYKAEQRKIKSRKLNHDRKHLIQIFKYANTQDETVAIPKLPLDLEDKHVTPGRVYSVEEFWRLHAAANEKWKLIIDMAAVMGMRRKEISTLEWRDIDFDQELIILPSRKTKTRQGRVFPIEKQILLALAARKTDTPSPWVFPNAATRLRPMSATDRTWQRIQKRAKVFGKFHWLRHSNMTWAAQAGHSPAMIGKSRGAGPRVVERVYLHANIADTTRMNNDVRNLLGRKNSESKPRSPREACND